jgi:hypothetical protein
MIASTSVEDVLALRAEQTELEHQISAAPYCGHWPIGSMASVCDQCERHERCDGIDRAIERLLRGWAR